MELLNAFPTRNPFLGTKLLGFSMRGVLGAPKRLSEEPPEKKNGDLTSTAACVYFRQEGECKRRATRVG